MEKMELIGPRGGYVGIMEQKIGNYYLGIRV